ncbi:MAG: hypothetical protein KKA55_02320 [Proteobacteria bacterium]|nr:hypothetical protein [Pseudomonadota bacterium]MBU1594354.1 hypothetical protein [Pseudomonadota bacterium]
MVSRRQEFKALGKWMCQLRPIGKEFTFKVLGLKGKAVELRIGGLENGGAAVSLPPAQLVYSEGQLFKLIALFDAQKITLDEVIKLRKAVQAQVEGPKK